MALPLTASYAAKTLVVFAAIVAIAAATIRRHHSFPRIGPANVVTTLRALLTAAVAGLLGEPHAPACAAAGAATAAVATALDGVDGWLARRTGMASAFGARYDMEVDALLIQILAILVWQYDKAGAWILASGLLRYAFVAAGRVWPWMTRPLIGSFRGKAICVVQIAGLITALWPDVERPWSTWIAGASLAALAYSFAVDTWWLWVRRAD